MAHDPSNQELLVTFPSDGVRVLALNRPAKRNALSSALLKAFLGELASASQDDSVRAIVVTGTTSLFSAGADIKEMAHLDAEGARACRYLEDLCLGMAAVRKPVLAAVEGLALGGGFELALMCDLIFASKSARFGLPEVSIGLIPGAGGTQRLVSAIGKFKTMQVVLLGEQFTGPQACELGLVAKVFDDGAVLENTVAIAAQLATKSRSALSMAKEAICRADSLSRDDEFERTLYYCAFSTKDKSEGMDAFLAKRIPKF